MASKMNNIRWIRPVLSHTEISCIASYYSKFSTNTKMKNHKINNSFVKPDHRLLRANKTGLIT